VTLAVLIKQKFPIVAGLPKKDAANGQITKIVRADHSFKGIGEICFQSGLNVLQLRHRQPGLAQTIAGYFRLQLRKLIFQTRFDLVGSIDSFSCLSRMQTNS